MPKIKTEGAETARKNLPSLLEQAHAGTPTIITRRGRPYAAIVPVGDLASTKKRGLDIRRLRGSGKGLWGRDSRATLEKMRREWQ